MRTVRTVAGLRDALRGPRRDGRTIGLVVCQPTLGALHEGHLSLVRRARAICDVVVVSLFVDPARVEAAAARLDGHSRDEARDARAAAEAGAHVLFAPPPAEAYPPGFATQVRVGGLTEPLEGAHRGVDHFHRVTTVATKAFNMAQPEAAFFGRKDAQQTLVIRRLVRDLDLPVRVEVCPTVRESDGLVVSSRNALLDPVERHRAAALPAALDAAREAAAAGERERGALIGAADAVLAAQHVEPEYLDLVSPVTLNPVGRVDGEALLAVAARFGDTRLIDNVTLTDGT